MDSILHIGPGNGPYFNEFSSFFSQNPSDFVNRGPGGDHVVEYYNASFGDSAPDFKGVFNISVPLVRLQFELRPRIQGPKTARLRDRDLDGSRDRPRDFERLIKAPLPQALTMQGNRDNQFRRLDLQIDHVIGHKLAEQTRAREIRMKFQGSDQIAKRFPITK